MECDEGYYLLGSCGHVLDATCLECPACPVNSSYAEGCFWEWDTGYFTEFDTCVECGGECRMGLATVDGRGLLGRECEACSPLEEFASFVSGEEECAFECVPGYFAGEAGCEECRADCGVGSTVVSLCSQTSDLVCEPCEDVPGATFVVVNSCAAECFPEYRFNAAGTACAPFSALRVSERRAILEFDFLSRYV